MTLAKHSANEALVKFAQRRLRDMGLYDGDVDGWGGQSTMVALQSALASPQTASVPSATPMPPAVPRWPSQDEVLAFYGPAGGFECTAGKVRPPIPFVLDWDRGAKVNVFSCHRKVEKPLNEIFKEAVAHYGESRFVELRLNSFGGCFNVRKMRGGDRMSMHSWGIAIDLDPSRNQLSWGRGKASFSRPEYEPFWKIVESKGGVSLGRTKNFDWMHFQFATL
jgi:hypothetical protein